MKLNVESWKKFYLKDLYKIKMGNKFDKNKMTDENPEVNFVSRVSYNNGVDGKVDYVDNTKPFKKGTLTVALGGSYLGSCFVQEEPYYTGQNVAIMESICNEMTHNVNLFISMLVRYESKIKYYAFGRELNTHINTDFNIKLPILYNSNGTPFKDEKCRFSEKGYVPDWQFMDNYIKSLHYKPLTTKNKKNNISEFKTYEWQEFKISSLFNVCAGKYYPKDEYEIGDTPYVSASDTQNGICERINLRPDFTGNKITIGKVGATTYYQSEDFCATSDVNVLTPLFNMNKYSGLFITQIINTSENYKWSYGRQCRIGDTNKIVIKLPILHNLDGTPFIDKNAKYSEKGYVPDWQFMEDYIKSLPYGDRLKDIM